jgi:enamine deaminase RidA (YjgF/YER057c/UK114 family)
MKPSQKLAELGLVLPKTAAPIGSYVPAKRTGQWVYTSGQLPFRDGRLVCTGKVPSDVPLALAAEAASVAVLNALAAAAGVAGGIDNIASVVRVCVYVNSSPGFFEQPKVANGASDLLASIFGEAGRHARSAVGAAELPMNAPVEIELHVEVESS